MTVNPNAGGKNEVRAKFDSSSRKVLTRATRTQLHCIAWPPPHGTRAPKNVSRMDVSIVQGSRSSRPGELHYGLETRAAVQSAIRRAPPGPGSVWVAVSCNSVPKARRERNPPNAA